MQELRQGSCKTLFSLFHVLKTLETSFACHVVDEVSRLPSTVSSLNAVYFGGAPKEKAGGWAGADPPKENDGCEEAALDPKEKAGGLPWDEVDVEDGAAPDPKLNFGAWPPPAAPKPNVVLPPAGALDSAACVVDSDFGADSEAAPKPNVKPLPLAAAPPDADVPPKPN
jgi:hypothetical protein